jgi:hypothetical protein
MAKTMTNKPDHTQPRSLSLYELESELTEAMERWLEADQFVTDNPGEGGPEAAGDLEILRSIVFGYLESAVQKRDRVAQFMLHLKTQEDVARVEVQRLQSRAQRFSKARERLKGYVAAVMEIQGVTKLEGEHYTLSLRKTPDAIDIVDEKLVPGRHMVPRDPVPDKRSIMEEYKMMDQVRAKKLEKDPGADVPEPSVPGTYRRQDSKTVVIR